MLTQANACPRLTTQTRTPVDPRRRDGQTYGLQVSHAPPTVAKCTVMVALTGKVSMNLLRLSVSIAPAEIRD